MRKLIVISEEDLNNINELTYHGLMLNLRLRGVADENTDIILDLNKDYGEILIENIKELAKKGAKQNVHQPIRSWSNHDNFCRIYNRNRNSNF